MFTINQQVVCHKSAMLHVYSPHVTDFSWLFTQGQALAHFKNHLKVQSQ